MFRSMLCSLVVMGLFVGFAAADDKTDTKKTDSKDTSGKKAGKERTAKITKVDAKKGTVTVQMKGKDGKDDREDVQPRRGRRVRRQHGPGRDRRHLHVGRHGADRRARGQGLQDVKKDKQTRATRSDKNDKNDKSGTTGSTKKPGDK